MLTFFQMIGEMMASFLNMLNSKAISLGDYNVNLLALLLMMFLLSTVVAVIWNYVRGGK